MPDGGCLTCNASAVPRLTSGPGTDYCTQPYYDVACPSGERACCGGDAQWIPPSSSHISGAMSVHLSRLPAVQGPCVTMHHRCAGQEYDPDERACKPCAAGEYRTLGRDSICLPW